LGRLFCVRLSGAINQFQVAALQCKAQVHAKLSLYKSLAKKIGTEMGIEKIFSRLCSAMLLLVAMLTPQLAFAEQRKLLVGGFNDIVIDGDMSVNIMTGKGASAKATGDRWILDLLKLDRVSETLYIRVQQTASDQNTVRIKQPLVITLTNQSIRSIKLRGNAKLTVNNIESDGVARIYVDGGGSVDIGRMKTDKLDVAMSGSGQVTIGAGSARETALQMQGAGIYDAKNLKTRKFRLEQNGNATVSANVEESAQLANTGSGTITITGNAECFIRRAGSAIITCPRESKAPKSN
jgi:Putative auto-transporter adhesin, head GIN domain